MKPEQYRRRLCLYISKGNAMNYLGIDVSKTKIDCCLIVGERYFHRVFSNNVAGFEKLCEWLLKYGTDVHVCMEATGVYSENVAEYLHDQQFTVSIVNPLSIKKFIEMELIVVKTDKQDAKNIAIYCKRNEPKPHIFPTLSERKLKALTRQLDHLKELHTAQHNRLLVAHSATHDFIQKTLQHLEQQISDVQAAIEQHINSSPDLKGKAQLLKTIRGIGSATVPHLLTLFAERTFQNAKKVVSYLGLNPIVKQSGQKKTKYIAISKQGDKHIRTALYMPAMVCAFRLPEYRDFVQRLKAKGKTNKQIICAIMRKLAVYCYTVLKTGEPFKQTFDAARSCKAVKGEAL